MGPPSNQASHRWHEDTYKADYATQGDHNSNKERCVDEERPVDAENINTLGGSHFTTKEQ
jgi:hypothetical protein